VFTARPAGGMDQRKCRRVGRPPAAVCVAAKGESKVNDSAVIAVGPPIIGRVRCAGGTSEHRLNLARSRETDRRNGHENRSPVFIYERSPTADLPLALTYVKI